MWGKAALVNLDKIREATVTSWACSPAKSQSQFHLTPQVPLLDQLRETVSWYRAEKWL
jgi:UDP-glucose 4-epimerase